MRNKAVATPTRTKEILETYGFAFKKKPRAELLN